MTLGNNESFANLIIDFVRSCEAAGGTGIDIYARHCNKMFELFKFMVNNNLTFHYRGVKLRGNGIHDDAEAIKKILYNNNLTFDRKSFLWYNNLLFQTKNENLFEDIINEIPSELLETMIRNNIFIAERV